MAGMMVHKPTKIISGLKESKWAKEALKKIK